MLLTLGSAAVPAALGATLVAVLGLLPSESSPGPEPVASTASSGVVAAPGAAARGGVWTSPLLPPLHVVRPFDPPLRRWLPGHRGVDLGADPGDVVRSAGGGLVLWAGSLAGRGVVSVLHDDGRRTTYEPVDAVVSAGDAVDGGDVLGRVGVGATHCGGLPSCLHWGLIVEGDYLDPLSLLRPGRPRLLPLGAAAP